MTTIALDTNVFIYALDEDSAYCAQARKIIDLLESGKVQGVSSVIVLTEMMRKPTDTLLEVLHSLTNHEFTELTEQISLTAAELSRVYPKLKPYDELHLASAIVCGAGVFYTNDQDILSSGVREIRILGLSKAYYEENNQL